LVREKVHNWIFSDSTDNSGQGQGQGQAGAGASAGTGAGAGAEDGNKVPSNVGIGPNAGDSIPAGPSARPTKEQQEQINEIGNREGCHTCGTKSPGTKSGNWVGDHQDPTKINPEGKPQRYYPQCLGCSQEQGGRIRWLPKPEGGQ